MTTPITIGTHNGHFHADEALAVHLLRAHVPIYANARLIRTRDQARLANCHTVVDVGGEYDAEKRRFDHHQRGFATTFPNHQTKMSSAGLVYLHFGREIIERKLAQVQAIQKKDVAAAEDDKLSALDSASPVSLIYTQLYKSFIEAFDAHDNGISKYDPAALEAAGITERFTPSGFTLGAMAGRFNRNWNEPEIADQDAAQADEDALFEAASRRVGEEFDRELEYMTSAWLPARTLTAQAFAVRQVYDDEGRILVFKKQAAPWKDSLYMIEEAKAANPVLYTLYPENTRPDARWRIQCVPVSKDSFQSRKPLPASWRGLRDEELDGVAGVPGSIFVHASGFIGGNKTFDGVLAMARKALAE